MTREPRRPVDWDAVDELEPHAGEREGCEHPRSLFEHLTGQAPFPWQESLLEEFLQRRFPSACNIPTGLGKTATIAVWLLALSHHAQAGAVSDFPRRLVYVVNRRTVVDQATQEVERMRERLESNPDLRTVADALRALAAWPSTSPLAISTLRGQFADNAEWRADPSRPAVIVGTVDMIGSRLLFSGYGRGFKSRPLHAGLLGQDTLLVHDEAHLEPAFQDLVTAIQTEQNRCGDLRPLRVIALTATSRTDGQSFGLTAAERSPIDPPPADTTAPLCEAWKRIAAKKGLVFHRVDDPKKIADTVWHLAVEHRNSGKAVLVYLRKLDDVQRAAQQLRKAVGADGVQVLTGTLRGLERDAMAREDAVFARFLRKPSATPRQGTVYLLCTSAGEVGVDISADHLLCDLTPFDSMAQRFGRVNRFGNGDARIDIVHALGDTPEGASEEPPPVAVVSAEQAGADVSTGTSTGSASASKGRDKEPSPFDLACQRTLSLLQQLPRRDDGLLSASPAALGDLPAAERRAAFTPQPVVLPTTDILLDSWALTSICHRLCRQDLPGRPPVADWLHGVATEWEPPETHIAWREEVDIITGDLLEQHSPEDLLEDYPLKPHELLRDRSDRVLSHLERIAKRCPDLPAWWVGPDGEVRTVPVSELVAKDAKGKPRVLLYHCTVVLAPKAGGLSNGILDGEAEFGSTCHYDVADEWRDLDGNARRLRVWDVDEALGGMRLVRIIEMGAELASDEDGSEPGAARRCWRWYVRPRSADDDGSRMARRPQDLTAHSKLAGSLAASLTHRLGLGRSEALAVNLASGWHDLGKNRALWQRSINNRDYPGRVLAKSGGRMRPLDLSGYRHELGSLLDISSRPELQELEEDVRDLLLHLVAAHHGRARPHFPSEEGFDPERADEAAAAAAVEAPRRFARLQRRYGRWGLAYLESLVRAADAGASQTSDVDGAPADDAADPPRPEAER